MQQPKKPGWWRRKSKFKKVLWIWLGAIVLLVVIIVAATSGGSKPQTAANTTTTAEATAVVDVTTTTAAGVVTTLAVTTTEAPTTTTAAKPKAWVQVTTLSGSANKRGEPFTLTGAPARLTYKAAGNMAVLAVYLIAEGTSLQESGGFPEVMVSAAGSDSTMLAKEAGNYYLDVSAANCKWTATIEEQR